MISPAAVAVDLLVIAVLIFLNAVFVAAEIALVTVRPTRLEQLSDEGNRAARRASTLISHPGRFLAVIQLAITFVGFLTAVVANESFRLDRVLSQVPALAPYASALTVVIVTAVISFVSIIFGELVPKTVALAHAERFALLLSGPIDVLAHALRPFVWLLTHVTNAITRLLGVSEANRDTMSTEELKLLVERGGEQGILEAEEEQMISAVMELGERRVHEVMVPRVDVVGVAVDTSLQALVDTIIQEGHSRIPVYEGSVDHIVGIVYAKDLLPYLKATDQPPDIRSIMRTPVFVPESRSVDNLLHEFQRSKVHMAVVIDEYGGTAGVVTIEDLIEEIVGEIQDEYDVGEEPMLERLSEDEARVDGRASVDDLAELFDVQFNGADSAEYDTVGGLVYHYVGGIPKVGDTVELDGLTLMVESTDGRRVGKVLARRRPQVESAPEDARARSA
jgi:putative hemolysin